jgi:histidine phosphotransferase ChpT
MNGLEVMAEDKDEETSKFAMDLIKKSAQTASAKLHSAGSLSVPQVQPGTTDLGDAEGGARLYGGRQDRH